MTILSNILIGEDTGSEEHSRCSLRRVAVDEQGMISLVTLVAVLFFLIVIGLVGNVSRVISQKIEVQNGADAVAYSSALVLARGMNAVTASNHIIGELKALVVLQHALNGDGEDGPDKSDLDQSQQILEYSYTFADTMKGEPMAVSKSIKDDNADLKDNSGATIAWSAYRLQRILAMTYQFYGIGGLLQKAKPVPIIGPILYAVGIAMCTSALIIEKKIGLERWILDALHLFAEKVTRPLKTTLQNVVIKFVYEVYHQQVPKDARLRMVDLMDDLEAAHRLEVAATFEKPVVLDLPIAKEPQQVTKETIGQTQLVRASYPWVREWRKEVVTQFEVWLMLARSSMYYQHFTEMYTRDKGLELTDEGIHLFVMTGRSSPQQAKGTESWVNDTIEADRLFTVMGFAQRPAPPSISPKIYPQQNPDGFVAYAQAMVYNANPQQNTGSTTHQAAVGWDTLNWTSPVPEWQKLADDDPESNANPAWPKIMWTPFRDTAYPRPQIKLNWQAKLVPVTRLTQARSSGALPEEVRTVLKKVDPSRRQFHTH